ncbi:MAG TPA: sialate O-acetylesterase [Polyangia bacterium]
MLTLENRKLWSLVTGLALFTSCGLKVTEYPNVTENPAPGLGGAGPAPSGGGGNDGTSPVGTGGSTGNNGGGPGNSGGRPGGSGTGGRMGDAGGSTTPDGGSQGNGGSTGGPAPTGGVQLGGQMVPADKAIAFIHFGHSNMAGRGQGPANLRPFFFTENDPRAWMFHATGAQAGFLPAKEPFTAGDGTSRSRNSGGPGTAIVKQAAAMGKPDHHFISVGFAQNALFCRNYAVGTSYFNAAIAGPKALKGKVTFAAIIIMLGITERHGTANDINNYPNCINDIVTAFRNELGEPDLPLLLTDYEMTSTRASGEDLSATGSFARMIIPRIHAVPSFISKLRPIVTNPPTGPGIVKNSALVPTDGLNLIDDHHFELDAQKKWAQDALDIMKEAGWFRWAKD